MSQVSLSRDDGVSIISVDHPPVNALSHEVRRGLLTCLAEALDDRETQAIVIHCEGRTFIAGADIREFDQPPADPQLPAVVLALEASAKPVVAALHGTALGGGLELALACHYRIALAGTSLGFPEVKLGLLPGASGTQRAPRIAGAEVALKMMLSGDPLPAAEALAAGLVDKLCDDELRAAAIAFAAELVDRGPRRSRDLPPPQVDAELVQRCREQTAKKARGLISPAKIIRAVELAAELDFDAGCQAERKFFMECKASPQSAGLRHAFFAERAAARVSGVGKDCRPRQIDRIAVIGAGTMGAGIAYGCLAAGFRVHLQDSDTNALVRGEAVIRELFDADVKRGKLGRDQKDAGLRRMSVGDRLDALGDADLVIEAIFENLAAKQSVFADLDSACKPDAILASNTSTLDIDAIAGATGRAENVIGLHFFSPAHIMRLLEIVRGTQTSTQTIATALAFAKRLGKVGVVVGNCYGFVGNRMLYSYGRENQLLLLEGAAPEFIDRVLFDWGMAMGPNAVGDLAGLDIGYGARQEWRDKPDDPRFYRVADRLVEMGRLGRKTGRGMYRYENGSGRPIPDPDVQAMIEDESARLGIERREIGAAEIVERCIYGLITEGARILEDGIATRAGDIDVVWINGYGFPRHRGGPMYYADTLGLDKVYASVCELGARLGPEYWEPPALLRELAGQAGRFADLAQGKAAH